MAHEEELRDDDEISLVDLAATLWKRKWLIVAVTVVAAVGSVVYALLQPNLYTATASMLPISGSASSGLSQYAGLAAMAGVSLPGASASDPTVKIKALLDSRGLAEKLVEDLDLAPKLIKNPEKLKNITPRDAAVEALQKGVLSVSVDAKTSLIKISAKTKDPALSSDITNGMVGVLVQNLSARALSASGKNIAVLDVQVVEQEKKVRDVQARMAAYQRRNKVVQASTAGAGSLALYQGLIQQKIALEIEISRIESALAADNPKLVAARTQLDAIKAQITTLEKTGGGLGPSLEAAPATMMEFANLQAELELAMKLYGTMVASLENMRLQEAQERLFVEVIDPAVPPLKKSEPSRAMICVVGTMAGGFLGVLLAFVLDALKKLVADPEVRSKFS